MTNGFKKFKKAGAKNYTKPKVYSKGSNPSTRLDWRFKSGQNGAVKPEPFPTKLKTRLKFSSDLGTIAVPALGGANWHTYRCNSIYDPDLTGFGRTVCGWSVLDQIYARYLVTGCKITVSFSNPTADGVRVGVRLRHANSLPTAGTTLAQLTEQPMTYISGLNNTGSQNKTFNFFVRPWDLIGISKLEYMANTNGYSAAMNLMPVPPNQAAGDGCVFDIFTVNGSILSPQANVDCVVKIVYYTTLYNRKALSSTAIVI